MAEKQLLKVVATLTSLGAGAKVETSVARGIVGLKRGDSLAAFADRFLSERGFISWTLNERGAKQLAMPPSFIELGPTRTLSIAFTFQQFDLSEVSYYAKDLSDAELLRDLKYRRTK